MSRRYRHFVAIAVVLAAGTHYRVVSAGGMQLKHRSKIPVPSAARRVASRESTINRGCTSGLFLGWIARPLAEMACALYNPAVVAARDETLGFRNQHALVVAETKGLVSCGHHSKIV